MGTRKGFTLIELLVVIAIIAILAAILFPVFASVKASAQKATCQSNLKQMGQAALLYEGDNDSYIMPGVVGKTGDTIWTIPMSGCWTALADKYIRMTQHLQSDFDLRGVYVCPSHIRSVDKNTGQEIAADVRRCYGYNFAYLGGPTWSNLGTKPGEWKFHKSGELVKSSKTVRLIEMWNVDNGAVNSQMTQFTKGRGTMFSYPPTDSSYTLPWYCWPPGWHRGLSAVCWCDGHVSMEKTAPPAWPPAPHPGDEAYYGVMSKTYAGGQNPYFRLDAPKP